MTFLKRGPGVAGGLAACSICLALGQSANAGTIQTTNAVYQLDSSQPGLPNYTPSVAIPAIETITPGSTPSDVSFSYVQPTPGTAAANAGQAGIVQGSVGGQWAAPYSLDGKQINSQYWSAGGGQIIVNFSNEKSYFGLLWGSVDTYNSLIFNNVSANGTVTQVAALTGSQVLNGANGNQGVGGAVWLNMDFLNGNQFNQLVFSDNPKSASFEFAAISTNSVDTLGPALKAGASFSEQGISVPEPGTIGLLINGIAGLAFVHRRRLLAHYLNRLF